MILSVTLNPSVDHTFFTEQILIGDTNRLQRVETDAGGKGINLSRVVHEVGAQTLVTGYIGGGNGAFICHVLDSNQVPHDFVRIRSEVRSNFNVEVTGGGPPTTFNAPGPEINSSRWERLLEKVGTLIGKASWLTLGGSLPPDAPRDAYAQLGRMASRENVPWLLDADGDALTLGLEAGPTMLKPNLKEAGRLLGREIGPKEAPDALRDIHELTGPSGTQPAIAILSMGSDGAWLTDGRSAWRGVAPKIEACSTIGSGDSLLGAFLGKLLTGSDLEEAFRWGLAAGAATAMTSGADIGRLPAIESLLERAQVEASQLKKP